MRRLPPHIAAAVDAALNERLYGDKRVCVVRSVRKFDPPPAPAHLSPFSPKRARVVRETVLDCEAGEWPAGRYSALERVDLNSDPEFGDYYELDIRDVNGHVQLARAEREPPDMHAVLRALGYVVLSRLDAKAYRAMRDAVEPDPEEWRYYEDHGDWPGVGASQDLRQYRRRR